MLAVHLCTHYLIRITDRDAESNKVMWHVSANSESSFHG